jgi:sialic acid synthase SpsE
VYRVSRQSVCALRDLPAGHVIGRQDVTVKRPGTGVPAARLEDTIGRRLRRAVAANCLLHDDDLENSQYQVQI